MTLTPASLRLDKQGLACGQGHIARGKTCHKRGAFPTGKAIAAGLTAGAVGAVLLNKESRRAVLAAPGALRRTTQRGITEAVHRATAPAPSMALTPRAFNQAKRELKRSGMPGAMRRHNLAVENLRRRTEPGYRKPRFPDRRDGAVPQFLTPTYIDPARQDACWKGYVQAGMKRKGKRKVPNCVPASSGLAKPRAQRDIEDGKKYTKVVTNPDTGRKRRIRYGAKGYRIAPGTDKGDRYCARSFGDMKSEGYNCAGAERNTPLCLSRAKWKCSGKTSRRDAGLTPGKFSA
jgi:hypothetical protein